MPTRTQIDQLLREGRAASWWPFLLAAVVLVAVAGYGITVYDSIPERLPLHFGADGEATRWGEKTPGNVFMPLLLTAASTWLLPLVAAFLPSFITTAEDASDWTRLRVEGTVRGARAGLGWVTALVALLTAWISLATWRAPDRLSPWPVAVLLLAIFVALPLAYRRWARWARSTARLHGIQPTPEEAAEERLWLPMGLYNNPDDPRVMVPKREGHGVGTTVNVGSRGGRVAVAAFVVVLVVPVVLILWLA